MDRQYQAYAAPLTWGIWVMVAQHIGIVTYTITSEPIGNTVIRCRVRYFNNANTQVVEEWNDDVTITTGNSVANVEVQFMGVPLGSAVDGTISP